VRQCGGGGGIPPGDGFGNRDALVHGRDKASGATAGEAPQAGEAGLKLLARRGKERIGRGVIHHLLEAVAEDGRKLRAGRIVALEGSQQSRYCSSRLTKDSRRGDAAHN
jgi:hypothetical protein